MIVVMIEDVIITKENVDVVVIALEEIMITGVLHHLVTPETEVSAMFLHHLIDSEKIHALILAAHHIQENDLIQEICVCLLHLWFIHHMIVTLLIAVVHQEEAISVVVAAQKIVVALLLLRLTEMVHLWGILEAVLLHAIERTICCG